MFLVHRETGLFVQSESNSLHNGTRLVTYPKRDGDTDQFKFDIILVNINELQQEIDRDNAKKKEIKFFASSDARAAANSNLKPVDEERQSYASIFATDIAKIKLGVNAKILATFTDPVLNISCDENGVLTLQDNTLDPAVWSIEMCNPAANNSVDYRNEIVGQQIRFRNHNNYYLACTVDGKIEAHLPAPLDANGKEQITFGSVWNIRFPNKHCYFICNENYPFSITRSGNQISMAPTLSAPEPRQFWNIYNV